MKYKVGDVVVIETDDCLKQNKISVIINDIQIEENSSIRYYGYTDTGLTSVTFRDKYIISYGLAKDVISDSDMEFLLNPVVRMNSFYKAVMLHLIRITDKYDLQILAKCNYLKVNKIMGSEIHTKIVVEEIFHKNKINVSG